MLLLLLVIALFLKLMGFVFRENKYKNNLHTEQLKHNIKLCISIIAENLPLFSSSLIDSRNPCITGHGGHLQFT
jgi:hypothetical protein